MNVEPTVQVPFPTAELDKIMKTVTPEEAHAMQRSGRFLIWCHGYGAMRQVARIRSEHVEIAGHTLPRRKLPRKGLRIAVTPVNDELTEVAIVQAGTPDVVNAAW